MRNDKHRLFILKQRQITTFKVMEYSKTNRVIEYSKITLRITYNSTCKKNRKKSFKRN